jgi:hypothetical protein
MMVKVAYLDSTCLDKCRKWLGAAKDAGQLDLAIKPTDERLANLRTSREQFATMRRSALLLQCPPAWQH